MSRLDSVKVRDSESGTVRLQSSTNAWITASLSVGPAQPRYSFVEVPGLSGVVNMTRHVLDNWDGRAILGQKVAEIRMKYIAAATHAAAVAEAERVIGLIHGKYMYLETSDGSFYGEVCVTSVSYPSTAAVVEFTVTEVS